MAKLIKAAEAQLRKLLGVNELQVIPEQGIFTLDIANLSDVMEDMHHKNMSIPPAIFGIPIAAVYDSKDVARMIRLSRNKPTILR